MLSRRYGDPQVGASEYLMHFMRIPVIENAVDLHECGDIDRTVLPVHS